ncbi:MAG TPA: complex I subunit 1 family protein [Phototrophicaceae bacterium]|nr:complex I subunit 1 family protein [Phototrophicaceae bacterium]
MTLLQALFTLLIFPGGLFLIANGLIYQWVRRKLIARLQNRIGPRWFQPLADTIKLLAKEEIQPEGSNPLLFNLLPMIALAGALTAALYLPIAGLASASSFPGDLIVTLYLLSLLTICTSLAGFNSHDRFSVMGALRTLTQLFAYEAPFMFALLGPAVTAGSWEISQIAANPNWLLLTQPIGFVIALIGFMGKLELAPFDAPEAETEIVAGALTEYSGRGLALFHLSRAVELVAGLTLIAAFYLGGLSNPFDDLFKTLLLLFTLAGAQTLLTRLRITQTVGLWWRYGVLLMLAQWLVIIAGRAL